VTPGWLLIGLLGVTFILNFLWNKLMSNVNTEIYDKMVDRAAMLRLYEKGLLDKVTVVIDGHTTKLSDIIKSGSFKQLNKLQEQIDKELFRLANELHTTSSRGLLDLLSDTVSYVYQVLTTKVGDILRINRPVGRIAENIVLKRPLYSDVTLSKGWNQVSLSERKRIEQTIRQGIAVGKTEADIALLVRKGNITNITKNQSQALVQTAITSVRSQADHEVYKANEKILRGWQYVAVLDSRTTPICAHRDGHVYPISDTAHLPPAHFRCRSTTIPVTKSWQQLSDSESLGAIRKKNFNELTPEQIAYYDGQSPTKETYNGWLLRQPDTVQLRHFGNDTNKLELFNSGKLTVDKFTNPDGKVLSIRQLRAATDPTIPGDTAKFADAKQRLDALQLGVTRPEMLLEDKALQRQLQDYYLLQAGDLDGQLSLTNYRGTLIGTKRAAKNRVLSTPPLEENLKFNPITGRYEDSRLFQPMPAVLENNVRLVRESNTLFEEDKQFISKFVDSLEDKMSVNQRAVVADNLRVVFARFRANKEPWANFKAVLNSQMKFDIMNVSDYMETQLRKDTDLLKKLLTDNYIDPVLGPVQLQTLSDDFIKNIKSRNKWEDKTAPKIARELRNVLDYKIPFKIKTRVDDKDLEEFYLRFAHRLSIADSPDRDQLAVNLGRDLYNMANYRGDRNQWFKLGVKLLDDASDKGFYKLETFGVQKRRMKARTGGKYFGPYYDTFSVNLRITDPRIQAYSQLTRKVDVGLRVSVTTDENRLVIREGYKTYFVDEGFLGYYDTRIPITSTGSFSDFPEDLIDKNMANALNWAANSKYKIDKDYFDAVNRLLYFVDDKGKSQYYNELNHYKEFIASRGDAYERFKAMQYLVEKDTAFSNHPFLDHRARIYDRGLISAQSGETFRPFLNSATAKNFSREGFYNLQDQIGGFLGGLSDSLEGRYNSLTVLGRQEIAAKWRKDLIKIGNHLRRGKPNDLRAVLESSLLAEIEGEEQGKALRFAIELSKLNDHLKGNFSDVNLVGLKNYKISIALEQDASSSGAQIIALTTKNKQLAELSNVIPTNQKKRLYDEIANATFNDPKFKQLNKKLGLTEKDLRKAAKAQNMVTFYGAGERTGIMNVENKLAKALNRAETLVVKAADRDKVLNEISARAARYKRFDPDMHDALLALRQDIKDIFNKGLAPGDDLMEQLYFLDPQTKDLVEKLTMQYESIVTPDDFATIATIMSEHLREQVPILKDFTKFFGRLAEDFVINAKPSKSAYNLSEEAKKALLGTAKVKPPELLNRVPGWKPKGTLSELLYGIREKKLPKSWTNIPWVNFDGKIIEQNFTQVFEERLAYKDAYGNWVTNILQVPQKTDPSWWDEVTNATGKINDIVDAQRARTAFAVNGNHSNDATIVKNFHLWGKENNIGTSTVHDAFVTNIVDMLSARDALKGIYAKASKNQSIKATLDEMRARGLPRDIYNKYLEEAIDIGLIPVVGRSKVGGKLLRKEDILTSEDILKEIPTSFKSNRYWYGIG